MTRALGYTAAAVALVLSIYGIVVAVAGARRERRDFILSAARVAYANLALMTVANLAMVYALVTRDFGISYVAQVGSRATPLFYTVISLWSALEGSILFWGWVLAAYTASVVYVMRRKPGPLLPYATATMLGVGAFFYLLLVGPANPFEAVWPVPADGPGPNPLLQNHPLMAVHPPLLYLGYVGMTVPFAFAVGALLSGRLDADWLRTTRRWTVVAWGFLSLAVIAGMWWSYEVLGWGGYWAWDPVENASFMPWLTATAFLHSSMVQERRDMLRVWNLTLVISTFLLTILGTFLTRSGVLSSVHAFTQGVIGVYFLGFIGVVLVFSLALLAGRGGELRSDGNLDAVASRETAFLLNNLVFAAFTFTVLLGTLFPLVAEAVRGVKVSVGAPFFNRMTVPLCVALLFLLGVGPSLPWRRAAPDVLRRNLLPPTLAALAVLAAALAAGVTAPYTVLALAFGAFAFTANVWQIGDGAAARVRAHGERWVTAVARLIGGNRRRYGGYIAHLGVVSAAVGIAASSTFKQEVEATLRPGESVAIGPYEVRFDQLWAREEPQRFVVLADLTVNRGERSIAALTPRLNYYRTTDQPITTPAVRSRPRHDLYVNLMAFERDGSAATLHVLIEPLVMWIWVGGLIVGLGAAVAVWPNRRSRALAFGNGPDSGPADAQADFLATGGPGDPAPAGLGQGADR